MVEIKRLGVWMDHSSAHLVEFGEAPKEPYIIVSTFTHQEKKHSIAKSESLMHHKEQHRQSEYYNQIAAVIRDYQEVMLFGPTDAKAELANIIKGDHLFEHIKIGIKQTDKMTQNQQKAFVKEYFSRK